MPTVSATLAFAMEIVFAAGGLVLLWREVVSPKARRQPAPLRLAAWDSEPIEFVYFILFVLALTFAASVVAGAVLRFHAFSPDAAALVGGSGAQVGMLAGIVLFAARSPSFRQNAPTSLVGVLRSGFAVFLISIPVLNAASNAWEYFLDLCGLPAERQDLIRMFAEAKSPLLVTTLVVLATVVAPVTEELLFRAGLFRFFRPRAPRLIALLVPAVIFAALHVNWTTLEGFASFVPLIVLALLFSLAYERTGNIGTTIVAHALFNLNTIILIFCGLTQ